MTILEAVGVGALGLAAGVIGGLAGVGGSLVMLPGLHLIYPLADAEDHHVFIAAAMSVNVAVAIPSALQHRRAGAVRRDLLRVILPVALACIVAGVLLANRVHGEVLQVALAVFILGYCGFNVWRIYHSHSDEQPGTERATPLRAGLSGGLAGFAGGLLGLGGGVVLVPMLQILSRVPLRQSIATSSAVICVTATIGATLKLATLSEHGKPVASALLLAVLMAPTAVIGGRFGAKLTHSLPLKGVRLAVTVLLSLAAINMIRTAV